MEIKKTPKADLQNKRSIFLLLGLIISMLITIGLFSYSKTEKEIVLIESNAEAIEMEMVEVTVEETKPPVEVKPQQAFISDLIKIVKDETKIEADMTFLDDFTGADFGDLEIKTFTKEEEVEEEIPVLIAEEQPTFQGKDINAFRAWCAKQLEYPQMAQENGIQGRVLLSFVVEKDGSVTNVKAVRGVDRQLDAEAIRVVQSSPKWEPGKNRGKAVRFLYNMPVDFILHQ